MIIIRYKDGLYCPVALCDECKNEITDASMAMYAWFGNEDSHDSEMFTLHKECNRIFEIKRNQQTSSIRNVMMWEEMRNLPLFLSNNLSPNRD
jgi:hypothetical protein